MLTALHPALGGEWTNKELHAGHKVLRSRLSNSQLIPLRIPSLLYAVHSRPPGDFGEGWRKHARLDVHWRVVFMQLAQSSEHPCWKNLEEYLRLSTLRSQRDRVVIVFGHLCHQRRLYPQLFLPIFTVPSMGWVIGA